jgi:hypothetical protein
VLLIGAIAWWAIRWREPDPTSTPASKALLAAVEASRLSAELDSRPRWDGERTGDYHDLDSRHLAFRIGVTVTALDVALAAQDVDRALGLLEHQQLPLVRAWGQHELVEPTYLHMATHLRSGSEIALVQADAVRAAEVLDLWLEGAYRTGAWAEAGRRPAPPVVDPATDLAPGAEAVYRNVLEALEPPADRDLRDLELIFGDLVVTGGGGRPTITG